MRTSFGGGDKVCLKTMLELAPATTRRSQEYRGQVGKGVQDALKEQFSKYDLTGKTWAALTTSTDEKPGESGRRAGRRRTGPTSAAQRYQQLVPSFTVMFPFFLAMVVGWVFVTERRQGTLKRLRFAPVSRAEILAGKLLPVLRAVDGPGGVPAAGGAADLPDDWGPDDWPLWEQIAWLLPVVVATSFASMGLALLVAAVSRSEIQVALFGALPVLVMALVSGCILPREMMTESAQALSWFTPHGWALAAYRELLGDDPQVRARPGAGGAGVRRADGVRRRLPGAGVVPAAAGLVAFLRGKGATLRGGGLPANGGRGGYGGRGYRREGRGDGRPWGKGSAVP